MLRRPQLALLVVLALLFSPGACRAQAADPATTALLAKIMEVAGGEERVRSVRSWRYKGVQTHRDSTGERISQVEILVQLPDRIHVESASSQLSVTAIYSPAAAFWVSGEQSGDIAAADREAVLSGLRMNAVNILQHASESAYAFRAAGRDVVAGVSVRILEISAPGGQARWYVDEASGRVLRASEPTAAGRTWEFSDWRWVEGGAVAFKIHYRSAQPRFEGTIDIQSIQFNPPTDPRLFARPPLPLSSLAFTPNAASLTPPAPPPPKKAALRISAQPGRAQVYLDDEPRGTASEEGRLVLRDLTPGAYRLRLTLAEYKDWQQSITLNPGDELTLEIRLVPRGPAPFTAEEIVEMLEGGVSPKRAATLVQQTGVDFTLTQAIEDRLRAAGADSDLLLAIAKAKK